MKRSLLLTAVVACVFSSHAVAQTYTMPTAPAGAAAYATTCSGTFVDNGGAGGNYTAGQDASYTFYPSVAGQYTTITFNSFQTQPTSDYLAIYDGPSGPLIGTYSGAPGVFTVTASASNSTGGLTCRFHSNGSNQQAGWSATIACTGTAGAAPAFTPNAQDCQQGGGTTICDNSNLSANSGGTGNINDLPNPMNGCLAGENQSSWYYFSPSASGTVGFTIAPANGTDDYDFALWGPFTNVQCPLNISLQPLRCSYSGLGGNTGCGNGAVDLTEGAGGDKWVSTFNVITGEIYVLVIDNYVASGNPFTLTWNLTNGADLNCTVLPVEIISFVGQEQPDNNLLSWQTATETNNDYFILDRSVNGGPWDSIATIDGEGNSSQVLDYYYRDYDLYEGIAYYRLRQRDFNGTTTSEGIIYIVRTPESGGATSVYPVPSAGNVTLEYNTSYETTITVDVMSCDGVVISTQEVAVTTGKNVINIDLTTEAQGVYAIQVRDQIGATTAKRVVIAKE
jgi:hypothetical protein